MKTITWLVGSLACLVIYGNFGCSGAGGLADEGEDKAGIETKFGCEYCDGASPEYTGIDGGMSFKDLEEVCALEVIKLDGYSERESVEAVGSEPKYVKLEKTDYTNQPIEIVAPTLGIQYDGMENIAQIAKADSSCSVAKGKLSGTVKMEYKKVDLPASSGLPGVKAAYNAYVFKMAVEVVYYGKDDNAESMTLAVGECPNIYVENANIEYEGAYDLASGCSVPFISDGVTYLYRSGLVNGCEEYNLKDGDEVIVLRRYVAAEGTYYVIIPMLLVGGIVESPCVPTDVREADVLEDKLEALFGS